jgi:hypothetical protein
MNELRYYLEVLLNHQCSPGSAACPECQSLHRIYQFMQTELFSTVIYKERPIQPRQVSSREAMPVNRAARL